MQKIENLNNNNRQTKMKNFYVRLISTAILLPPIIYAINFGGFFYFMLLFVMLIIAGYEYNNICGKYSFGVDSMFFITFVALITVSLLMNRLGYAAVLLLLGSYITYMITKLRSKGYKAITSPANFNRPKWMTIGFIYLSLGFGSLAFLSTLDDYQLTIMWVALCIVACDSFAYIGGNIIGGKKIWPAVSPKKSWSGFFCGALASIIISYIFSLSLGSTNELMVIIFGFLIAVFGHVGDFIESSFKRYVGIKDTSGLIPGHGGMLDRVDALLVASLFIAIVGFVIQKSPLFLPI